MATGGWVRHRLLTAEIHFAGTLILSVALPLGCVGLTWSALHLFAFQEQSAHLVTGAAILSVTSFAILGSARLDQMRPRSLGRTLAVIIPALLAFLVLAGTAGARGRSLIGPMAIATFSAAFAEEAVFRVGLPAWLSRRLARAGNNSPVTSIATVVIPQLAFAAAHFENASFANSGAREFAGLFVSGILYQGMVRVSGLWAAAAVHAALNLTIALAALRR